jgi:hypothetical protein
MQHRLAFGIQPTHHGNCKCHQLLERANSRVDRTGGASKFYECTWNLTLLFSVAFGPVTVTKPLVAPAGTVAEIRDFETASNGRRTA